MGIPTGLYNILTIQKAQLSLRDGASTLKVEIL